MIMASYIATVLSMLGNILLAKKNKWVFPVWIISNILWITINIIEIHNTAQMLMYSFYTVTSVFGWINWNKTEDKTDKQKEKKSMNKIMDDYKEVILQITKHQNETNFGEPQAYILLENGRSLEVTHEEEGLRPQDQFYSWRVHCSEEEFNNDTYHKTMGVIDKRTSDDLNKNTCLNLLRWAYKIAG